MMDTTANAAATNELITQLAEAQVENEQLKEALNLQGDDMARRARLFEEFVKAWRDGRDSMQKKSFWTRIFGG